MANADTELLWEMNYDELLILKRATQASLNEVNEQLRQDMLNYEDDMVNIESALFAKADGIEVWDPPVRYVRGK